MILQCSEMLALLGRLGTNVCVAKITDKRVFRIAGKVLQNPVAVHHFPGYTSLKVNVWFRDRGTVSAARFRSGHLVRGWRL